MDSFRISRCFLSFHSPMPRQSRESPHTWFAGFPDKLVRGSEVTSTGSSAVVVCLTTSKSREKPSEAENTGVEISALHRQHQVVVDAQLVILEPRGGLEQSSSTTCLRLYFSREIILEAIIKVKVGLGWQAGVGS